LTDERGSPSVLPNPNRFARNVLQVIGMSDLPPPLPLRHPHLVNTSRGTNQSRVKLYNERLILSLIRSYGSLSKTEIAKRTGLSLQTSSVIMQQLERKGLLLREKPLRGKVGQPSVPMSPIRSGSSSDAEAPIWF
jgi:predicted transcriptional regulator